MGGDRTPHGYGYHLENPLQRIECCALGSVATMQARRGCRDGNKCFKTRGECAIVPRETVELLDLGTEYFDEISTYMHVVCGPLDRNRTCIWRLGGARSIH
jgi:hypothetical protein